MKLFTRIAALIFLSVLTTASLAGPPFNVDDPSTVEHKHFNLNITYLSSQVAGSEAQGIPSLALAYGLRNNIELDLGLGINSVRTGGIGRKTGFGDVTPAIKWRFKEETKNCPQFALGYQVKVPTASVSQGLGNGATDHIFWMSTAKSFKRLQAFGNVGYNFLGSADAKNNLFYGVGMTYQATETLIVGAQLYGNTSSAPGSTDELAWGVGAIYNFAPNRSFLFQVGRSTKGFSDLNLYAGLSFSFK